MQSLIAIPAERLGVLERELKSVLEQKDKRKRAGGVKLLNSILKGLKLIPEGKHAIAFGVDSLGNRFAFVIVEPIEVQNREQLPTGEQSQ